MIEKNTLNGELLLIAGKNERFVFRKKGLGFFAFRLYGTHEQAVGHVKVTKRFSLKKLSWVGIAECGDIFVKDEFQRKGIGSSLLSLCLIYSEGISEIIVRSKDLLLLEFLKKNGFVERWSASDKVLSSLFCMSKGFAKASEYYFGKKEFKTKSRIYVSA